MKKDITDCEVAENMPVKRVYWMAKGFYDDDDDDYTIQNRWNPQKIKSHSWRRADEETQYSI